ncbi:MAG: CPBP family intramembrane metalloprotease [Anaerolineales bacterium]|jgi:membrane protease YdiL (CAAX protease family)
MKTFKKLAIRYPYLFMVVIYPLIPYSLILLQLGIAEVIGLTALGPRSFQDSTKVLAVLIYVFILWRFGWCRPAGFQSFGSWQAWLIMVAASVFELALTIFVINGHFAWSNLTNLADPPAYLLVGLFEEIAFRGLILYAFLRSWEDKRFGVLKSVFVSSVLFGLGHLVTVMTGNTLPGAIFQAASTTISGILYAALVLYGQSIWPAVIGHFLVDSIGYGNLTYVPDFTQANLSILLIQIPLLFLGLHLIYRYPRQKKHSSLPVVAIR